MKPRKQLKSGNERDYSPQQKPWLPPAKDDQNFKK